MDLLSFFLSTTWRIARVVIGIVLIALGLLIVKGAAGTILAVIGAVMIVLAFLNICMIAKLWRSSGNGA